MARSKLNIRPGAQGSGIFENDHSINYLLFLPATYGQVPERQWPLILYLHGLGESGYDVGIVKRTGLPQRVESEPDFPFLVLSPQCPQESGWWAVLRTVAQLMQKIRRDYQVDGGRIYLTGNSMGGYGSWALAAYRPHWFAAVAPICGGGVPELACELKEVPVWAFHGAEDDIVPVSASEEMVDALLACGGDVRFTILEGVGHDSWTPAYQNPELFEWFLARRREG